MVTAQPQAPVYAPVPSLWPGGTIVCIASGPSLTAADVAYCRDRAIVLAVKDAIRLAPWADALYACDARWWRIQHALHAHVMGPKYSLEPAAAPFGVSILRDTGREGLELDPTGLRTGQHSGYQAINLAVHFGARRIVLLGYDLRADDAQPHYFGPHPWPTRSWHELGPLFRAHYETLRAPLETLGVTLVNCSRETALESVPRASLQETLA